MANGQGSSVIVVEIDTRKGPARTMFESSVHNQSEQAKQFWKTLSLSPHIESSLYSKEILQQLKTNKLKPMTIDNSRKVPEPDMKIEAFLKNVQMLNQVDQIMNIQRRAEKIENIRQTHRLKIEKSNETSTKYNQNNSKNFVQREDGQLELGLVDDYELEQENEESLVRNLD